MTANTPDGPMADRREWSASQVKVYVDTMLNERDRLHAERFAHLGSKIDAVSDRAALALDASKEAIGKSEASYDKRFEAANRVKEQFAETLTELQRSDVADRSFAAIEQRLKATESFQQKLAGALVLASLFVPLITGLAVYLLTRHGIAVTR